MTLTPLQRQQALETEAKNEAIRRIRERTQTAEAKNYASSSVYGQKAVAVGLQLVSQEIRDKISSIGRGQSGKFHAEFSQAPALTMDPDVLALITLKVFLDHSQVRVPRNTYQLLCNLIGSHVYDEWLISRFAKDHPADAEAVRKYQQGLKKGYAYRLAGYRARMRKISYEVPKWSSKTKHTVGAWLLDRLSITGWVATKDRHTRGKRQVKLVEPSEAFTSLKLAVLERTEALAWCHWPMLCEPVGWSDQRRGGYLDSDLRQNHKLVRTKLSPSVKPELNRTPALRMLNRLQRIPYKINRLVYEVALECQEKGETVGKFKQERPLDPPNPPDWETASKEAKVEYRRERTRIEDHNHSIAQSNYRSDECLFVAKKFLNEVFWIPWSFDYRGRVYPLVTCLSPQGTDFEKSLILFAEEGPVNEKWLAFQVATTYGLDKSSMKERQEWVRENVSLISRVANDPMDNLHEVRSAEEPWCFLAACVEYNDCVIEKSRSTSGLPVSVDATCSGLQHLAGLTLDKSAAEMVNVVPTPKPTDAYAVVAAKAKEFLPEEYHPLITRKVTKRTVMTTPYGVTQSSARDYIRQELPKELPSGDPVEVSKVVESVFRKAIPAVIPGPIKAMEYIQKTVASLVTNNGSPWISWVSPSGFPVIQYLPKLKATRIETKLLGSRVQTNLVTPTAEPDVRHHRGASAPNLIHSLDAALLHLTFADYTRPFTLIHDCLLVRSCDLDQVSLDIREQFVRMYQQPVLRDWAAQLQVDFDESVIIGNLDITQSLNSPYLFC